MKIFKRIVFGLPFLLCFFIFSYELNLLLQDPSNLLSIPSLMRAGVMMVSLVTSSFFFIIFATLAFSWLIVLPIILLASLPPLLFTSVPLSYTLSSGFLLSLCFSYFLLERKMENYFSFQPTALLIPPIKQLITIILLVASFGLYLTSSSEIANHGFTIPQSFVNTGTQLLLGQQGMSSLNNLGFNDASILNSQSNEVTQQLQTLTQNPTLLQQLGVDPALLNQLINSNTPSKPQKSQSPATDMIEQQINTMIKPYLHYLPLFYAGLFFISLWFFVFFLDIFLYLPLWLLFLILEQTGFIRYVPEMKEVKKLALQ
ncbi:MAG: hypothetical protein M1142_01735 [Patescibacteria group bacterium]|nr:hypothetical protein [Patescibacteria group bacterium]